MITAMRARSYLLSAALAVLATLAPACRSPHQAATPTAECPVCKHEGDLACLCVHVEPGTPRCQCGGETYYFCSDECRADFLAHPERYVPKR